MPSSKIKRPSLAWSFDVKAAYTHHVTQTLEPQNVCSSSKPRIPNCAIKRLNLLCKYRIWLKASSDNKYHS